MLGAASHLFAVKRRWIDWSGRVAEEERYWFMIWPVGVVRSGRDVSGLVSYKLTEMCGEVASRVGHHV